MTAAGRSPLSPSPSASCEPASEVCVSCVYWLGEVESLQSNMSIGGSVKDTRPSPREGSNICLSMSKCCNH